MAKVYDMMNREAPEKLEALRKRLNFVPDELVVFKEVANGLSVPKDDESGIIWQCDNFDTMYADVDIEGSTITVNIGGTEYILGAGEKIR